MGEVKSCAGLYACLDPGPAIPPCLHFLTWKISSHSAHICSAPTLCQTLFQEKNKRHKSLPLVSLNSKSLLTFSFWHEGFELSVNRSKHRGMRASAWRCFILHKFHRLLFSSSRKRQERNVRAYHMHMSHCPLLIDMCLSIGSLLWLGLFFTLRQWITWGKDQNLSFYFKVW